MYNISSEDSYQDPTICMTAKYDYFIISCFAFDVSCINLSSDAVVFVQ